MHVINLFNFYDNKIKILYLYILGEIIMTLRFIKNANLLHSEASPKTHHMVNLDASAFPGLKTVPTTKKSNYLGGSGDPDGVSIADVKSGTLITEYKISESQGEPEESGVKKLVGVGGDLTDAANQFTVGGENDFTVILKAPKTGPVVFEPSSGTIVFFPFSIASGVVMATEAVYTITVDGVAITLDNAPDDVTINSTGALDSFVADMTTETPSTKIVYERDGDFLKISIKGDVAVVTATATTLDLKLTTTNDIDKTYVFNGTATTVDYSTLTGQLYDDTTDQTIAFLVDELNAGSSGRLNIFQEQDGRLVIDAAGQIKVVASTGSEKLGLTVDDTTDFDSDTQTVIERSLTVPTIPEDSASSITLPGTGGTINQKYANYVDGKAGNNNIQIL